MVKSEGDRERDRRERERERKKRKNRKYGQARLKHSKRGVFSCILSGVSFGVLFLLLVISYLTKGNSAAIIGSFGVMALLCSCASLLYAVRGFRERDKNYKTCKIGLGSSIFLLACFLAIFIRGLM